MPHRHTNPFRNEKQHWQSMSFTAMPKNYRNLKREIDEIDLEEADRKMAERMDEYYRTHESA